MYGYNYFPQSQPNNYNLVNQGLKGRPVSSLEEVKAAPIDFDGSMFYFPDVANKRIYTKQIAMDGTSSILMYELKPVPKEVAPDYVTKEELEKALSDFKTSMANTVEPKTKINTVDF